MLRIPAVIAVLGLSALTLAACASAPGSASCDRVDSDSSIFDVVHSSGEFGTPETTLDAPVNVDATTVRDETAGDGLRVTSDDQDVFFSVSIVDGATGKAVAAGSGQIQSLSAWRERASRKSRLTERTGRLFLRQSLASRWSATSTWDQERSRPGMSSRARRLAACPT